MHVIQDDVHQGCINPKIIQFNAMFPYVPFPESNENPFFVTTSSETFSLAAQACNNLNATLARIETSEEFENAKMASSSTFVWTALIKRVPFITFPRTACFSSLSGTSLRERMEWVVGENSTVDRLPWPYSPAGSGPWKFYSCTGLCITITIQNTDLVLKDALCRVDYPVICSNNTGKLSSKPHFRSTSRI